MTNRPTSRRNRYRSDAFASGGRPSQARPSTAPPRRAASASGEMRPGGGRRRLAAGGRSGAGHRQVRLGRSRSTSGVGRSSSAGRRRHRGRVVTRSGRRRASVASSSASFVVASSSVVVGLVVVLVAVVVVVVVVVVLVIVIVVSSSSSSGSTGRPMAPHVATAGTVGGSSSGWPGRCRQDRMTSDGDDEQSDTICAVGTPKNVQLSVAERLEREPHDAVPDEEDQEQVARPQPLASVEAEPDQDDRAEQPRTATRTGTAGGSAVVSGRTARARVGRDAVGAVDRDAPRQGRRRAVQLLVEEVAPARDGLHHEQARRDDVRPAQERDAASSGRTGTRRSCPVTIPP